MMLLFPRAPCIIKATTDVTMDRIKSTEQQHHLNTSTNIQLLSIQRYCYYIHFYTNTLFLLLLL